LEPNFRGAVFNYESQILYISQNYKNASYTMSNERFLTTPFVIYFRKNHFLIDEVNTYIELMHANGFIKHTALNYFVRNKFQRTSHVETRPLEMHQILGIFKIYVVCLVITFVVFIIELLSVKVKGKLEKCHFRKH
jgi:hypothetical protein